MTEWNEPSILWQSTPHARLPEFKKTRDVDRIGSWHALYKIGRGYPRQFPKDWSWRSMSGQVLYENHHNRIPVPLTNIPQLHLSLDAPFTRFPDYIFQKRTRQHTPIPELQQDTIHTPIQSTTPIPVPDRTPRRQTGQLETLEYGERNDGLFDYLRTWAWRNPDCGLDDMIARARWARTMLPDLTDFTIQEADRTAGSVWRYKVSGRLIPGFTPEQRARGGKVKAERVNLANADRNAEILALAAEGKSLRRIGEIVGLGKSAVSDVLKKEEGKGVGQNG